MIRTLASPTDLKKYDSWIKSHLDGNLWQSLERKTYLEALDKEVRIYIEEENGEIVASALIAVDRGWRGATTWEIARGPLARIENYELRIKDLLEKIMEDAKKENVMTVYLSPNQPIRNSKFVIRNSPRHVHCEATRIVDLTQSEEGILAQMKSKGRYNIRVAEKHGVTVKESDDIDVFFTLVKDTGNRDGFTTLSKEKYAAFLRSMPGSFLLLAYDKQTEPIAGVLSVVWNKRAIYYYGCSKYTERAKMAPYALQWESMKRCKALGCTEYDLLGIAPPDAGPNHPWNGITSFKEKFGGTVVLYPHEKMIVLRPWLHRLIKWKRKILG